MKNPTNLPAQRNTVLNTYCTRHVVRREIMLSLTLLERATLRRVSPASRCLRALLCWSGMTIGLRPNLTPRAKALARPRGAFKDAAAVVPNVLLAEYPSAPGCLQLAH